MGRFYKTDSATPLDYMYSINTPLMEKTLATNDQGITDSLSNADRVGTLANYNHLQGDEADAKAITDNYTRQIEDVSDAIRQDPANWKKQLDPIRNITKALQEDYRSGAISKHVANYNKRKADFDAIDKQVELYNKTGGRDKNGNMVGIDPTTALAYKNKFDSEFQGTKYDPKTGGNIYKGGAVMNNMDIEGTIAKGVKDMKDSGFIKEDPSQKGMYLIQTEKGFKGVTPERIMEAMKGNITPELMQYMKSRSDVGLLNNVFAKGTEIDPVTGQPKYKAGQFIEPYQANPNPPTKDEIAELQVRQGEINQLRKKNPQKADELQAALNNDAEDIQSRTKGQWNKDSYLSNVMQGVIGKYTHGTTTDKTKITADPVALPVWKEKQANNRNAATISGANWRAQGGWNNARVLEGMKEDFQTTKNAEDRINKIKDNPNLRLDQKNSLINDMNATDTFIADPHQAFEPKDLADKSARYLDLINKDAKQPLDPQSKEELNQLNLLFGGVAKNLGITPEQMKDITAYNNGDKFGSIVKKVSIGGGGSMGLGGLQTEVTEPTPKYLQTKELADKILKEQKQNHAGVKDLTQALAANTSTKDLAYIPSRNTTEGKSTFDLIDKLFESNVGKNYYNGSETYYDNEGKLKPSNFDGAINVPILGDHTNSQMAKTDPLKYLMSMKGGKASDYIHGLKVKMDGNKMIVSGSLDVGGHKQVIGNHWWINSLDQHDVEGDANNFQLVFDDVDSGLKDIYGSSKTFKNSPSGKAFLDRVNPTVAVAENKVNKALPYLTNKGQKQTINGVKIENIGGKYKVNIDGKDYETYGGQSIITPDQLKAIVAENQ